MKFNTDHFPLVSVIIPCFNCEATLCETIESVCNQTYPRLEILFVNDQSTDNTFRIYDENQRSHRSMQWIENTNKGVQRARNLGLKFARGRYIKFMDADDLLDSQTIEAQVLALNSNPDAIAKLQLGSFSRLCWRLTLKAARM